MPKKTKALVSMVLRLLARDAKGNAEGFTHHCSFAKWPWKPEMTVSLKVCVS